MITNATQITVLVKNLEEAKKFYTENLGFTVCADQMFASDWRYLTMAHLPDWSGLGSIRTILSGICIN